MLMSIFQGLDFMHETVNITHGYAASAHLCRDIHSDTTVGSECVSRHIMMDASPLYEHSYDPAYPTLRRDWAGPSRPRSRTSRPVRYYFVDFGISTKFEPSEKVKKVVGAYAQDDSVPELSQMVPYDPFAVDVYTLGNIYKKQLLEVSMSSSSRVVSKDFS